MRHVIINTTVVSGNGKNDTSIFTSTDKIYLLSGKEVWNDSTYDSSTNFSRQLDYYKSKGVTSSNCSAAIKKYNGTNTIWWLRTAISNNDTSFINVSSSGSFAFVNPSYTGGGFAPAFRIG